MAGNHTLLGGFECGDRSYYSAVNGNARLVYDARNARTGDCYLLLTEPVSVAALTRVSLEQPTTGLGPSVNGDLLQAKFRAFFYLEVLPSGTLPLISYGYNNAIGLAGSVLNANGTFACARYNAITGASSTAALVTGRWYRGDLTVAWTKGAVNTTYNITFSVYEENGTLVETVTIVNGLQSHTFPDGTDRSLTVPTLGGAGVVSKRIRFDDFWHSIHGPGSTPSFPTATRCTAALPTGQGVNAAWTGDWRTVRQVPRLDNGGAFTFEQTTTGTGNTTTFTHKTAAQLGLAGIEGVRVWGRLKYTGGTNVNHDLLWNGVAYPTLVNSSTYAGNVIAGYGHALGAMSNAAFDAAEFGARTSNGNSIQLGMSMIEVLHAGAGVPYASLLGDASFKLKVVAYAGTGAIRTVTGVGFMPSVVLIKMGATGTNTAGALWIAGQGTTSKDIDTNTWRSDKILSATADGFELSPDVRVNAAGSDYVAICLQDGGQHVSGFFLKAGLYAPTGTDGWDEILGIAPDFVLTAGGTASVFRNTDNSGDESFQMSGVTQVTNYIQALNADGAEFGTDLLVGSAASAEFIPWIALRTGAPLAHLFKFGSVVGAGASGTITGIPFTPHFVYAGKLANIAGRNWRVVGFVDHTGTNSGAWTTGNVDAVVGIASMTADGFTGGSNIFQSGVKTQWFAFADGAVALTVAVPNVVGLTLAAATSALTAAGLVLGTVSGGDGVVEDQTPDAGTIVLIGSAVDVVLAVTLVAVPNVGGLTQAAASALITTAGLVVGTVTGVGTVVDQTPEAAALVTPGSAVDLVLDVMPVLTDPGPQTSTEYEPASLQLVATYAGTNPLTYGAASLPAGLSIDTSTGLISGTLDGGSAGLYSVTVSVDTGWFNAHEFVAWTVLARPIVITPADAAEPETNLPYSQQLTATGGDGGPVHVQRGRGRAAAGPRALVWRADYRHDGGRRHTRTSVLAERARGHFLQPAARHYRERRRHELFVHGTRRGRIGWGPGPLQHGRPGVHGDRAERLGDGPFLRDHRRHAAEVLDVHHGRPDGGVSDDGRHVYVHGAGAERDRGHVDAAGHAHGDVVTRGHHP